MLCNQITIRSILVLIQHYINVHFNHIYLKNIDKQKLIEHESEITLFYFNFI